MSDQFAKAKIRDDFDYLISALFTEMIVNSGYEGIYCPSVQSDGRGYNVAITREATDTKLRLFVAGEGRIYKRGKRTLLENETLPIIEEDSKEFSFEEIADK